MDHARSEVLAAALDKSLSARLVPTGAGVSVHRVAKWFTIAINTPSRHLARVLECLAEAVVAPGIGLDDAAWAVRTITSRIPMQAAQPHTDSAVALLTHLYGRLPAAMEPVARPEQAAAVSAADLAEHHRATIGAKGAFLVVVGEHDPQTTMALCRRYFDPLPATNLDRGPTCPPPTIGTVTAVERSQWSQTHIRLAASGIDRADDRHLHVSLANAVFGGYFSSRLTLGLREREGLAYRVQAMLGDHLDRPMILIEADTAPQQAAHTTHRILSYLRQMAAQPVTGEEVDRARRFMTGTALIAMSSQIGITSMLSTSLTYGDQPEGTAELVEKLDNVSTADVRAAAAEFYDPDRFTGVVVGNTEAVREGRSV
ncbi:pitrilysin family protein [Streptomyces sp. ISL-11]|uniref:M16 family metallopeptidase n=1 Tax=Streptomyces sp. ISL-11 TaxID=2819174 RepID=UPI001BE590AA|nr:insulinase family protein [Streptomyces sp. ISL-11]MBT2386691.1 insulinase family protein [Streptomyces sp. ISL-11]